MSVSARRRGTPARGWMGGLEAVAALAVLLLSLGFVAWRQPRALDALAELERVRSRRAVLVAERTDLERRVQRLESRGWVVPEAERRLGLRTPRAEEIVILPGEGS